MRLPGLGRPRRSGRSSKQSWLSCRSTAFTYTPSRATTSSTAATLTSSSGRSPTWSTKSGQPPEYADARRRHRPVPRVGGRPKSNSVVTPPLVTAALSQAVGWAGCRMQPRQLSHPPPPSGRRRCRSPSRGPAGRSRTAPRAVPRPSRQTPSRRGWVAGAKGRCQLRRRSRERACGPVRAQLS